MNVKLTIIMCLLASAVMTALLALYALKRERTKGVKAYAALMTCISMYSAGYAAELHSVTLEGMLLSLKVEYIGISFLPVAWLAMALEYTGQVRRVPKWFYRALFIVPILTFILHYTNSYHHLFYSDIEINRNAPFPVVSITKGVWYHVNLLYLNMCVLAGNILFFLMQLRSRGRLRKQAFAMFAASLFPWGGSLIYQAGLSPYNIDVSPFALSITGPVFALALFRFHMFDLAPIARDTVFEVMHDPVLALNTENRLADYNRAAQAVFPDLGPAKVGGLATEVLGAYPDLRGCLEDDKGIVCEGDMEVQVRSGKATHVFKVSIIPIRMGRDESAGKLVVLQDITEHKKLLARLRELANKDELTGIFNRRRLMEACGEELVRAARLGRPLSLIILDLDHFKRVNDTHGHQAGDEVLQGVARVIQDRLRPYDIFGRYGGEEFAVVLPETAPESGREIAERLRRDLEDHPLPVLGGELAVTASFGVAGVAEVTGEHSVRTLLQQADMALYRAKDKGRNRVELWRERDRE